jgi:hypothetical protein
MYLMRCQSNGECFRRQEAASCMLLPFHRHLQAIVSQYPPDMHLHRYAPYILRLLFHLSAVYRVVGGRRQFIGFGSGLTDTRDVIWRKWPRKKSNGRERSYLPKTLHGEGRNAQIRSPVSIRNENGRFSCE